MESIEKGNSNTAIVSYYVLCFFVFSLIEGYLTANYVEGRVFSLISYALISLILCVTVPLIAWLFLRKKRWAAHVFGLFSFIIWLIPVAGNQGVVLFVPQTYEECMLEEMKGQDRSMIVMARTVCSDKPKESDLKKHREDKYRP